MVMRNTCGLTSKEVKKLLNEYGYNRLAKERKNSALKIFLGQLKDIMVIILLISTGISLYFGEIAESITIIAIVFVNAILGFVQEYRTEKTMDALKKLSAQTATVIRDKIPSIINADEIVPGDLLLVEAGDIVPADCIIIKCSALCCDESILTGESISVDKTVSTYDILSNSIGRNDMIYMGCKVTSGNAKAVVIATGMSTQMGNVANLIKSVDEDLTPLQIKLNQLGKYIGIGSLGICAIVATIGILKGEPIYEMLLTGISLAVAAVPEGLPAIVTISLAIAVRRILKKNAVIKHLHAVETMGCVDVICSDKTGTLTENKMTVKEISTIDYNITVTGTGYKSSGELLIDNNSINIKSSQPITKLIECAIICNNAEIEKENGKNGEWQIFGDPTEASLLIMGAKARYFKDNIKGEIIDELPFDSKIKRMSVVLKDPLGDCTLYSKGAADIMINHCDYIITENGIKSFDKGLKNKAINKISQMGDRTYRVLGFAYKNSAQSAKDGGLTFIGLTGMVDPLRLEAFNAVDKCKQAGIKTVMITGDHVSTATAIAKELRLIKHGQIVISGQELNNLSDEDFDNIIDNIAVFARVTPEHKLRIVRAYKKKGHTVAMTGDGVNDAPAIKEADIGISMFISGSDVTKEAADLILLDDNFSTIVSATEEGRAIYQNIRKFIRYLLSCNIGEVITMLFAMLIGMPIVLTPIQILFVNLVTDGLPAIALGLEPGDKNVMKMLPRKKSASIFSDGLLSTIIFRGIAIGFTTLFVYSSFWHMYNDISIAGTGAFVTLIFSQLIHVFECKSESKGILSINIFNNIKLIFAALFSFVLTLLAIYYIPLSALIGTVALNIEQLKFIVLCCMTFPLLWWGYLIFTKKQ